MSKNPKADREALPSGWLRRRLLVRLFAVIVPAFVGAGVCLGALLGRWLPSLYLVVVARLWTRAHK